MAFNWTVQGSDTPNRYVAFQKDNKKYCGNERKEECDTYFLKPRLSLLTKWATP